MDETQRERFEQIYLRNQTPVMQSVERCVFGCDYGATSWANREEADRLVALLELAPGVRLLDVGAGSGWPGLYMAGASGCDIVLVDVPLAGLRIAAERAVRDNLPGECWVAAADGAKLPFGDASFDAISHSDVLCCLVEKRAVLESCRRVIRSGGRMVVSDVVTDAALPDEVRGDMGSWSSCVGGALPKEDYLAAITEAGFAGVEVLKTDGNGPIASATVRASKP